MAALRLGIIPAPGPFVVRMQETEQTYVDQLFAHLDGEVARAQARLEEVQRDVDPDNPDSDALVRRETEYHGLNAKLDALNVAETGLVSVSYTHLTLPTICSV